jgi:hypothetical protein
MARLGIVLAAVQIVLVGATHVEPLLSRAWRVRTESALVRSARLSYGDDFAKYVLFARQVHPGGCIVVIRGGGRSRLSEMPFMQYFLFPRSLTNCPAVRMVGVRRYGSQQTYLIAVDSLPAPIWKA